MRQIESYSSQPPLCMKHFLVHTSSMSVRNGLDELFEALAILVATAFWWPEFSGKTAASSCRRSPISASNACRKYQIVGSAN